MMAPLRIVDTGLRSARWNVAMTAALAELRRAERIGDTLRFHRYPKSVLIGRHQILAEVVQVDRCRREKVEIARRFTGGGAVYMAPGALAWDVVIGRGTCGLRREQLAAVICEAVAASLAGLGLNARYRPPNDIAVEGRKICGASGYFDGETMLYQGTILIDNALDNMAAFLRFPAPLAPRALAQRVATVAELLGRRPRPGEIEAPVAKAIARALGCSAQPGESTAEELRLADTYFDDEFGSDRYVEGVDVQGASSFDVAAAVGGAADGAVRHIQRASAS